MYKLPVSVLVVVHTAQLEVLLLERASRPGYWQSVTGSLDRLDEPLETAAAREVMEETGIDPSTGRLARWNAAYSFEIYAQWRHRFAPGTVYNTEHVFGLALRERCAVKLAPREHVAYEWLAWDRAAPRCFSWSNRDAIHMLGERAVLA
jgi:dATP pyrophosphohydrolase